MPPNQTAVVTFATYKLFFDDIEELFLRTISWRSLMLSTALTWACLLGILIFLHYRSTRIFSACLIPFLYALIFYDIVQLLAVIILKLNFTEQFLNQLCRWPYYLKALGDAGQCLTLIFLFGVTRHQIRYFLAHHHLPSSDRIHSRALALVCLLFIVYVNNWITHLKVEMQHVITPNAARHEIHIEEEAISAYETLNTSFSTYERLIGDLNKYSDDYAKHLLVQHERPSKHQHTIPNDNDGSGRTVVIKLSSDFWFNTNQNRSERTTQNASQPPDPFYRINRCTYGQTNFFLAHAFSFIHSTFYVVLLLYYVATTTFNYRIPTKAIHFHQQIYEQSLAFGRGKSAERHRQFILLIHLRYFLRLLIFAYAFFTLIRLTYTCVLTLLICFAPAPLSYWPIKRGFHVLFLINFFSIPVRMCLLFLYLFLSQFCVHLQSIFSYLFRTKLRCICQCGRTMTCCHLQLVPFTMEKVSHYTRAFLADQASSMEEEHSTAMGRESVIVHDETSVSHYGMARTTCRGPLTPASDPPASGIQV